VEVETEGDGGHAHAVPQGAVELPPRHVLAAQEPLRVDDSDRHELGIGVLEDALRVLDRGHVQHGAGA